MGDLLGQAIEAHGGLTRWEKVNLITVKASIGGLMWDLKGKAGILNDVLIEIDPREQRVKYSPFLSLDQKSSFRSNWVGVERTDGTVVEERSNPRDAFNGHVAQTKWDDLDLVYFASYAMWGYFTAPFHSVLPGITTEEIEPWEEDGEQWRRLKVNYPSTMAVHSPAQTFYFDRDGFVKRVDYNVDISGSLPSAQYISDHHRFDGIVFPTRRRVHPRQPDNHPNRERLGVSINVATVTLS